MRAIKIILIVSMASLFSLFTLNNIQDFDTNWLFVQHVLSMDTTFKHPSVMWRAITNTNIQLYYYYFIIAWESVCAIVCWMGGLTLFINRDASSIQFNQSKKIALIGLSLAFILYLIGFILIGGEWFCMWQSSQWNAQSTAGLWVILIMLSMIILMKQD